MPAKKGKGPKATAEDAQICLKLYELRRDETLRKARNYVLFQFNPTSQEEFNKVAFAFGTPEQTYCRMVWSYWEQAAALVNRGAVHGELFDDWSGECYFLYAKFRSYIGAVRREVNPHFFEHIENLVNASARRKEMVQRAAKTIEERLLKPAKKEAVAS
jgi:hypothetical protein